MHQPRPHGKFGQEDATRDDMAFAESLMRHVTNIKQTAGLDSFKLVRALPDGGMVVAQDMGGIVKTIIRKPTKDERQEDWEDGAPDFVPMLFCGVVQNDTLLSQGQKVAIRVTQQTRKRLAGYKAGKDSKIPERMELERFTIKYHGTFSEFEPKSPDGPQPRRSSCFRASRPRAWSSLAGCWA